MPFSLSTSLSFCLPQRASTRSHIWNQNSICIKTETQKGQGKGLVHYTRWNTLSIFNATPYLSHGAVFHCTHVDGDITSFVHWYSASSESSQGNIFLETSRKHATKWLHGCWTPTLIFFLKMIMLHSMSCNVRVKRLSPGKDCGLGIGGGM